MREITNMLKKIISILNSIENKINPFPETDYLRLQKIGKHKKNLKIHLGCGPRILKGWINIDLMFEPFQNYLKYYGEEFYPAKMRGNKNDFFAIDVTKQGLPLEDNSVDVIFHEDFIEHINQKQQIIILAETLRVLKKGGIHRINTPNLISSMKVNSNFRLGINGVFQQEWDKYIHLNILTPNILKEAAHMVGYSKVLIQSRNKSKSKLLPKEYRPDKHDRPEDGNLFADLIK